MKTRTLVLSAADAAVNGALILMDTPLKHTIHYWNNTDDTISWDCEIPQAGNYLIKLNYSLNNDLPGGLIQISVGDEAIEYETPTTASWLHFDEFEAGQISVKQAGPVRVELKGLKLPIANETAFPDIHTVSLILN